MFRKNINFIFFFLTILILGINPFLCKKALTQERTKLHANNERREKVNDYADKDYHNNLVSNIENFHSALFLEKSHIQYEKAPYRKSGKIIGEILIGSIGSLGGGIAGATIGSHALGTKDDFIDTGAIIGLIIGSGFGNAIGVYLIGTSGGETGSFLATVGGGILGTAVGIGGLFIFDNPSMVPIVFILSQSIGSTIAYNATAKKREESISNEAVLHFKEGKWSISNPKIQIKSHPLQPGQFIKTVNVVSLEF